MCVCVCVCVCVGRSGARFEGETEAHATYTKKTAERSAVVRHEDEWEMHGAGATLEGMKYTRIIP